MSKFLKRDMIGRRLSATVPRWCLLSVALCCALPWHASAQESRRARTVNAVPAGEVVVILGERTFNALFEAVFTLEQPLSYPLGRGNASSDSKQSAGDCASQITLAREAEGVTTAVRFHDGRITAPLAFSGSYDAPLLGCLNFRGAADTSLDLSFDQARQVLMARVTIKQVQLKNVPAMFADGVTGLVQDAVDARLNPIEILRAEQLSARVPLKKAGHPAATTLRLRAKAVRHEIAQGELRLRIAYEFVRDQ